MPTPDEKYIVRWEDGTSRRFPPYDGIGMTAFVVKGLNQGRVFYEGREVELSGSDRWQYKE